MYRAIPASEALALTATGDSCMTGDYVVAVLGKLTDDGLRA